MGSPTPQDSKNDASEPGSGPAEGSAQPSGAAGEASFDFDFGWVAQGLGGGGGGGAVHVLFQKQGCFSLHGVARQCLAGRGSAAVCLSVSLSLSLCLNTCFRTLRPAHSLVICCRLRRRRAWRRLALGSRTAASTWASVRRRRHSAQRRRRRSPRYRILGFFCRRLSSLRQARRRHTTRSTATHASRHLLLLSFTLFRPQSFLHGQKCSHARLGRLCGGGREGVEVSRRKERLDVAPRPHMSSAPAALGLAAVLQPASPF